MQNTALFEYYLRIGDSSLIAGHRLSEWCGHGPFLEEDIAMTNLALDLIGQARTLLQYAGAAEGQGRTEDDLAYKRAERKFFNILLAEQPNGDFAYTMAKNYFISVWNYHLYSQLSSSTDEQLAAFAVKSLKEVTYHVRHTGKWMLRLGDGTQDSHARLQKAINELWMFTGDLFAETQGDLALVSAGVVANMQEVRESWKREVKELLAQATIEVPADGWMQSGSRAGKHTEHLGFLLAEMQYLPRAYPDAIW